MVSSFAFILRSVVCRCCRHLDVCRLSLPAVMSSKLLLSLLFRAVASFVLTSFPFPMCRSIEDNDDDDDDGDDVDDDDVDDDDDCIPSV